MENKILISARKVEEFNDIKSVLDQLSEKVRNQIISAKKNGYIECELSYFNWKGETIELYLPNETRQISHFEDEIFIYCGEKFLFKILDERYLKKNITYNIEEKIK